MVRTRFLVIEDLEIFDFFDLRDTQDWTVSFKSFIFSLSLAFICSRNTSAMISSLSNSGMSSLSIYVILTAGFIRFASLKLKSYWNKGDVPSSLL